MCYNIGIMKSLYGFDIRKRKDGRRNPDNSRKVNIKELWDLNHEILRLAVLGLKSKQIADYLGCTPATVSNTINSDIGKEKLAHMRGARDNDTVEVAEWIKEATQKSLKIYDQILDEDMGEISWRLKKATADTVVKDLAGHEAPKKVLTGHFSLEEIEAIKLRGKALAKETGDMIDVTPTNKLIE